MSLPIIAKLRTVNKDIKPPMAYGLNPVALPKPTPPRKHIATVPAPVVAPPPPPKIKPKSKRELDEEAMNKFFKDMEETDFDALMTKEERDEYYEMNRKDTRPLVEQIEHIPVGRDTIELPKSASSKKFKLKSKEERKPTDPYAGYTGPKNKDGSPNRRTKEGKAWFAKK